MKYNELFRILKKDGWFILRPSGSHVVMMKKNRIKITVIKERVGYSATTKLKEYFIGTEGTTFEELKQSILSAINLVSQREGCEYKPEDLEYSLDLPSVFNFYKVINAKAFSERLGINQSLLAQYISGNKKPSLAQKKRILDGVRQIGQELQEIAD